MKANVNSTIIIRGGGDLASGVAARLHRAGFNIVITELPRPLTVRRKVAFSEAIYSGPIAVEGISASPINNPENTAAIISILSDHAIPIIVDPECRCAQHLEPVAIIDARMMKRAPDTLVFVPRLLIGLGPGFIAGENCNAVIETRRGHTLGRVYWSGPADADTGLPDPVKGHQASRVLRAPAEGSVITFANIGDHIEKGQAIAEVMGQSITAPFSGILRGLAHPGLQVKPNDKIGDLDPRDDPSLCVLISDKALAVGGGVLEALLTDAEIRRVLCR